MGAIELFMQGRNIISIYLFLKLTWWSFTIISEHFNLKKMQFLVILSISFINNQNLPSIQAFDYDFLFSYDESISHYHLITLSM